MRWQVKHRMDFIEKTLREKGTLNRSDLMEEYGISAPQASMDIQKFLELYPEKMTYDKREKTYIATRRKAKKD